MNNCLVSIIIPVYNTEKYINKCLNSICLQTYSQLEIIIVNDGSKDNSLNIINEFVKSDNRIALYNKENGGLNSAVSFGINVAKGDYIAFVDSDDYIGLNYIENFMKEIDDSDVISMGFFYENEGRLTKFPLKEYLYTFDDLNKLTDSFICSDSLNISNDLFPSRWNKLYKSNLLKSILNIYKQLSFISFGEDSFFTYSIIREAKSIKCVAKCNEYYYNTANVNAMTSVLKSYNDFVKTCDDIDKATHIINVYYNTKSGINKILHFYLANVYINNSFKKLSFFKSRKYISQIMKSHYLKGSINEIKKRKLINIKSKIRFFIIKYKLSFLLTILCYSRQK